MMNMTDFVNEMMQSLPTPETLRQEKIQRAVETIMKNLRSNGKVEVSWGHSDGTHACCTQVAKRVCGIFESLGYETTYTENAASNTNRYCKLTVVLP